MCVCVHTSVCLSDLKECPISHTFCSLLKGLSNDQNCFILKEKASCDVHVGRVYYIINFVLSVNMHAYVI